MLPPPAITTRRAGLSCLRSSFITRRRSLLAARKNTSSPSSMLVSPSGRMLRPARKIATTRASIFGRCSLSSRRRWPTSRPPLSARTPTSCTLPSGEIQHLQSAGIADQPLDVFGDELLRADEHIDRDRFFAEELRAARVFGGADARDLGRRAKQRVGHFAGHHVHFVAARERDDDVGFGDSGGLEHGRIGGVAGDGADVEAILQVAQRLFVGVDDGDFVGLLAGEVRCGGAADLARAEDDDLHCGEL